MPCSTLPDYLFVYEKWLEQPLAFRSLISNFVFSAIMFLNYLLKFFHLYVISDHKPHGQVFCFWEIHLNINSCISLQSGGSSSAIVEVDLNTVDNGPKRDLFDAALEEFSDSQ